MWQSSNDEDTLWNEWKQLTCVGNLRILMWDRSHQWVLLSYIWCWRQLKCRRCTTRGCPAAVSDWGVSFPRCPEARGAEKKASFWRQGLRGPEGQSNKVRLNQWYRGMRDDEGKVQRQEGWTEGGRGINHLPWRQKGASGGRRVIQTRDG